MLQRWLIAAVGILAVYTTTLRAETEDTADLLKNLKSDDMAVRLHAIDLLGEQGEATPEVLDALSKQFKDASADVRGHAAHAAGHLGPAARPIIESLAPLVVDSDAQVRRMAVRAWARIQPGPDVSLPLISKAFQNADPALRAQALEILAEIGKPAVPSLVQMLKHEEASYWACLVLGEIGPDAAEATPALADRLTGDSRPEVRREAALALGGIGPAAVKAVPALVVALDDKEATVCAAAALSLGRIGPDAKAAAPALVACGNRADRADPPNLLVKTIAAWALAKIEPQNEVQRLNAISLLAAALNSKQAPVRLAAARGLADLKPSPELVIPAIKEALQNADKTTVANALQALAALGKPAVPFMIESLKFEQSRPAVARILGHIGPDAKQAVPALTAIAADDQSIPARCEALMALGAIGPAAAEAVPAAIAALGGTREDICHAACYALGQIGPAAMAAEPSLQKQLGNADESIALSAAWALARIDPASAEIARQSVPLLVKGLTDSEPRVRVEAAASLEHLGRLAKEAVPSLKQAMYDKDEAVRIAAEKALKAVGK